MPLKLLAILNHEFVAKISKNTIYQLKQIKGDALLSGCNSGLNNCWDEICIQTQEEYSIAWPAYKITIESIIEDCLNKESPV